MFLRTILVTFVSVALWAQEDPPKLTTEERLEIALELARYQEARAAALAAQLEMVKAQIEVERLIRSKTPPGFQLNPKIELEKRKEKQ